VHCYEPDGTLIGKIVVPAAAVANVAFGGLKRNRLFMAATTAVYSIHLKTSGLALV
jgi:gluconolactonase